LPNRPSKIARQAGSTRTWQDRRPVHRQRRADVLELAQDERFEQVVAGRFQRLRGQPVGLVLAECCGDQAESALGLPVGQQVRAVFPVRDHAQPPLVAGGPGA